MVRYIVGCFPVVRSSSTNSFSFLPPIVPLSSLVLLQCVYYRLWIPEFSLVAEPIFRLFRCLSPNTTKTSSRKRALTQAEFIWGLEQPQEMERLKAALIAAPALKPIVYTPDSQGFIGQIVLGVDASQLGYGAILQQEDQQGRRHPSRYESGLWTPAEAHFDAGKLDCQGLLRALKKFRYYVYGVNFLVEIDAKTLVHQLNQPATDLPGAVVGRWLAYIRMFSFDIQHVPGARHKGPDALSRRPPSEKELHQHEKDGEKNAEELEYQVDAALGRVNVHAGDGWREYVGFCTSSLHALFLFVSLSDFSYCEDVGGRTIPFVSFQRGLYSGDLGLIRIGEFLSTFRRPAGVGLREYAVFKKEALKYLLRDGVLSWRGKVGVPPRHVVGTQEERNRVLRWLHDDSGHRGRGATYQKACIRYYWDGLYRDVDRYVRSCGACQKRRPHQFDEPLHPTFTSTLWMKLGLDVVHMPVARDVSRYMVGL